jgi:outer membrane protein assembly factor BamA
MTATPLMFLLPGLPPAAAAEPATADQEEKTAQGEIIYFPVIFYSPETELALGGAMNVIRRPPGAAPDSRPSSFSPSVIVTTRKQLILQLGADLYSRDERRHATGRIGFVRFPDRFFGLGNGTDPGDEEGYTQRTFILGLRLLRALRPALSAGLAYDYASADLKDFESGGLLESGDVPGAEGGRVSGLGALVERDTRDAVFFPREGGYATVTVTSYRSALGSDFAFMAYGLDVRRYLSFGSGTVLALQGVVNVTTGSPPFQLMPSLGGESELRGYFAGRFRDRARLLLQGEYRLPRLWRRFGLVFFAGAGQVADDAGGFAADRFHGAAGWGIRCTFSEREGVNLRLDSGYGEDDAGFYVGLGEVF